MTELREKWINDFVAPGKEIIDNGETLRPSTKVSIAIGKVLLEDVGKNNIKTTLKVPGAKYNFSGFLNDNHPVAELLKQAQDNDYPIAVRFEKKRKKNADPRAAIEDLTKDSGTARENIVNIVSGVYNFNNESWILTDDAVSNPAEDPEYVKTELTNASYSTKNFFDMGSPSENLKPVPKLNNDWKVNHLISMYTYASEHNFDNEVGLAPAGLKILAKYMLQACDSLQTRVYGLDEPNYNDYSHTKVRGMLFSWMRTNPLSKEIMAEKGGFTSWINRFVLENTELYDWAKEESGNK